jgi:hypothetical protein
MARTYDARLLGMLVYLTSPPGSSIAAPSAPPTRRNHPQPTSPSTGGGGGVLPLTGARLDKRERVISRSSYGEGSRQEDLGRRVYIY